VTETKLAWQSKAVLLAVLPFAATNALLESLVWFAEARPVAIWTLGLSALLGLITWRIRAATAGASATGAMITASLMLSTIVFPYEPWHTALIPVLAVSLLAFAATRVGRRKKARLDTAEAKLGRAASQVAANLGVAGLVVVEPFQSWLLDARWLMHATRSGVSLLVLAVAALAEAGADTVSSEIGQVLGGKPRLITTFRAVEPGRDGAVSIAGTLAGALAAGIVAGLGTWALRGGWRMFWVGCAGAVFGLFFDSLLGATMEERGWLNNDAVNFLSTASSAGFALAMLAFWRWASGS
jgi:uncharacterized protein (TIGR00297 family)